MEKTIAPGDLHAWRTSVGWEPEQVAAMVRALGMRLTARSYLELERGWFRGSYELLAAIAGFSNGILTADALRRRPLQATKRTDAA